MHNETSEKQESLKEPKHLDCFSRNDDKKEQALQEIQDWLKELKHIRVKADEVTLSKYLKWSGYNVEKAKKRIQSYYELRGSMPIWFRNRDPYLEDMQILLKNGLFLPILKADSSGHHFVILRIGAQDPHISTLDSVFKICYMTLDLFLAEHQDVSHISCLYDLKGVTARHGSQLSLNRVKTAVHSWQDCYPVRVKSLNFVNSPVYVDVVLNLFRRFMKKKLRDRIFIHGYNLKSLHEQISPEVLPEEYGGSAGTISSLQAYWHKEVTRNKKWYAEDETFTVTAQKGND